MASVSPIMRQLGCLRPLVRTSDSIAPTIMGCRSISTAYTPRPEPTALPNNMPDLFQSQLPARMKADQGVFSLFHFGEGSDESAREDRYLMNCIQPANLSKSTHHPPAPAKPAKTRSPPSRSPNSRPSTLQANAKRSSTTVATREVSSPAISCA